MEPESSTLPLLRPPANPYTDCSDISRFLILLQSHSANLKRPYIHPVPISFVNNTAKVNWASSLPDTKYRHTFS